MGSSVSLLEACLVIRTRTYFPPYTKVRRQYNNVGALVGTLVTTHPTPHAGFHPKEKVQTIDWTRTPNYKTVRQTQGYLPCRGMTQSFLGIKGEHFNRIFRSSANPLDRFEIDNGMINVPQAYDYCESVGVTNPLRSALVTDAQYDALSKARDMKFNFPVFLGEARTTARMIGDTAQTLGRAYGAFRKGNFRRAAKALGLDKPTGAFANNWLAYSYGWRPLLSDAVGMATTLYDFFENTKGDGQRITVKSSWKKSAPVSVPEYHFGWSNSATSTNSYADYVQWSRNIRARAGLLLEVEYQSAALAASLGVGLTDPLLTAWELTPFSFVFDWFVDVGSWLEARSSLQGYKVLTGFFCSELRYDGTARQKYITGGWNTPDPKTDPKWSFHCRHYSRSVWGGGVTSLRMPLFDALNGRRIVTSASLWRQRLSGDRNPGDPYPRSLPRKRNKS